MNGKTALEYLSKMSEEELKEVNLIWFDKDTMRENLDFDNEDDEDILENMKSEEIGEILEESLYSESGDIRGYFNEFLGTHDEIMKKMFYKHIK